MQLERSFLKMDNDILIHSLEHHVRIINTGTRILMLLGTHSTMDHEILKTICNVFNATATDLGILSDKLQGENKKNAIHDNVVSERP